MDTNKKILIGAIGAAVVIGGIAIGLLLSKTPEKADLSTIHTEAATEAPKETLPAATQLRRQRRPQKARKTLLPVFPLPSRPIHPERYLSSILRWTRWMTPQRRTRLMNC